MSFISIRYLAPSCLLFTLLAAPPMTVATEAGAGHVKLGVLKAETPQSFDGMSHEVDPYSSPVLAVGIEKGLGRGFAMEFEGMAWKNSFTTPSGDKGDAQTAIFQVIGKKYFGTKSRFYPFVGVGVGGGTSSYSFCNGLSCFKDSTSTVAVQGLTGVDVRFGQTSLMLEFKLPGLLQVGRNYAFEPGGPGLFLGIGQRW